MGGCQSSDPATKEEAARSKKIESGQKDAARNEGKIMKILLLGAGESGKSTIFKQMKIIHQSGYDDTERQGFIATVVQNIIQNMQDLLIGAERLDIPTPEEFQKEKERFLSLTPSAVDALASENVESLKNLWAAEFLQNAYAQRSKFQLADSAKYYFEKIDEIADPHYVPDDQDILRTRVRTSGIVESTFVVSDVRFKMFDVGGQRNERRKWIHCFDNVQAVLFVAAMSEYDQQLYEDETQNRMEEALLLFHEICNSKFFAETSMILFLNKSDLFREKMKTIDLKVCFEDYTGGLDYDNGVKYLKQMFMDRNETQEKQIYIHVTCATDTTNVRFVFEAVKDIILTSNLRGSGFI